jgi:DNA mismatch endonuclease (patch repair protein)
MKKKKAERTKQEIISYTMSRIRSKNTSIEVTLRKALWSRGVRYRANYKNAPGTPDIAITKHKIAIFCDGEFWHGKDLESQKRHMHTNEAYWMTKILKNMARDAKNNADLAQQGWTVLRFWGKDIAKDPGYCVEQILKAIETAKEEQGRQGVGAKRPSFDRSGAKAGQARQGGDMGAYGAAEGIEESQPLMVAEPEYRDIET